MYSVYLVYLVYITKWYIMYINSSVSKYHSSVYSVAVSTIVSLLLSCLFCSVELNTNTIELTLYDDQFVLYVKVCCNMYSNSKHSICVYLYLFMHTSTTSRVHCLR